MKELYKQWMFLMLTHINDFLLALHTHTHRQTDEGIFTPHCHHQQTRTKLFHPCFVWIVFIVLAVVMALSRGLTSVQWVITARPGPGPNTSTRVQLDP